MSIAPPLRCLIVEDSEDDARLLVRRIQIDFPEMIFERVDTPDAMRVALEHRVWDVVLSDYSMPHFSGVAALELLRASGLDVPFILVTGSIGEAAAVSVMKAGAHDFLLKGDLLTLAAVVNREIAGAVERRRHRESQSALAVIEARHRTILKTAMDGFWLVDHQGRLLEVNETYARMSGYSVEELLGLHISDLEALETVAVIGERIRKIVRQGQDRFETKHRRKDGSVFDVEVSAQRHTIEGELFVCFLHDITTRKNAEVEIARQLDELKRWQSAMLDREDRVQELKREVNELARRCGEAVRYPSQEDSQ